MQVGVLGVCRGRGSDRPPWTPPHPHARASQSQHFQQVVVLFKFKFILIDVHFCGVPRADLMHDILYDFLIGVNMSISLNRSFISSENNHNSYGFLQCQRPHLQHTRLFLSHCHGPSGQQFSLPPSRPLPTPGTHQVFSTSMKPTFSFFLSFLLLF